MILLINCGSYYFKNICTHLDKQNISYEALKSEKLAKVNLKKYLGFIISGSPLMLSKLSKNKRNEYLRRFKFIKNCNVPILGICHGHHVIGLLFGSKINHGKLIEGNNTISIYNKTTLLKGFKKTPTFREDHAEYISLPNNFILLADSKNCKVECMKHKSKNIFGMQFHPEASRGTGQHIFKNFHNILKRN